MVINKIKNRDELTQSLDLVAANIAKLKELFPQVLSEGKIDFKVLQEILGQELEEEQEYYRFTWAGKAQARREAHKPSTGTLRPCKVESVDWDSTQNLYIEGDNLEVLKLLQKSYLRKIKLIYIDPPYNTGKDFVYRDNYQDNLKNYQQITGQVDNQGNKLLTNTESDGRYHSNWLNMMYPRLLLARNLLKDDGVIFISIDDNEQANLKRLCDEIFGEDNFIAQIVWKKRSTPPNDKVIAAQHEYILCFSRDSSIVALNLRSRTDVQIARYKNPDGHEKGPWVAGDLMANIKGGRYVTSLYYAIVNPRSGQEHYPSSNGNWRFSKEKIDLLMQNNQIYFGEDDHGRPKLKRFLCDVKGGITWTTLWDFAALNTAGSTEMTVIFRNLTAFENPKPTGLLLNLLEVASNRGDVVLDFFSGASSMADAVMQLNAQDGGKRKFIMVQIPEACSEKSEAFKAGYKTITEIGKERIRRAGKKIKQDNPLHLQKLDIGFKVFKLDSSNIKGWDGQPDNLETSLWESQDNIKSDRTEEDILFEILLKYGLDLTLPLEEKIIAGKKVFSVGAGALFVCLADEVSAQVAEGIGQWKEALKPETCRVIFKDSGFTDVDKTNTLQTLKRCGVQEVKSI